MATNHPPLLIIFIVFPHIHPEMKFFTSFKIQSILVFDLKKVLKNQIHITSTLKQKIRNLILKYLKYDVLLRLKKKSTDDNKNHILYVLDL